MDQFADGLLMGFTQLFTGVITILGTLGFMLSVNAVITLVVVLHHARLPVCGGLHRQADLRHVPASVPDAGGTDRL